MCYIQLPIHFDVDVKNDKSRGNRLIARRRTTEVELPAYFNGSLSGQRYYNMRYNKTFEGFFTLSSFFS